MIFCKKFWHLKNDKITFKTGICKSIIQMLDLCINSKYEFNGQKLWISYKKKFTNVRKKHISLLEKPQNGDFVMALNNIL